MKPNRIAAVLLATTVLLLGAAPAAAAVTKPPAGRYKLVPCKAATGTHMTTLMACFKRVGNHPMPLGR